MGTDGDKAFDEYLAGDSAVSRRYRAQAQEEPSPALDQRVITAARRAVRPAGAHSPFARSWMVPASVAAVLVLAVSLVLLTPRQVTTQAPPRTAAPKTAPALPMSEALEAEIASPELTRESHAPQPAQADESLPETLQSAPEPPSFVPPPKGARPSRRMSGAVREPQSATLTIERAQDLAAPASETRAAQTQLEAIHALLDQGRLDEARAAYAEFRQAHPDYPVDAALLGSLGVSAAEQ